MRVKVMFAWYDFWVGLFWDRSYKRLYCFPIPIIGVCIHFKSQLYEDGVTAYRGGSSDINGKNAFGEGSDEYREWLNGWSGEMHRST